MQFLVVAPTEEEVQEILETTLGRAFALQVAADQWRKAGAQHPFGEHFRGYVDWVPERYDRKTLEAALAAVPPELIGFGLLWGTPERVAGKLRAYGESGVRHIVLFPISMLVSWRAAIYALWAVGKIARLMRNAR